MEKALRERTYHMTNAETTGGGMAKMSKTVIKPHEKPCLSPKAKWERAARLSVLEELAGEMDKLWVTWAEDREGLNRVVVIKGDILSLIERMKAEVKR
jgi:hypothetical protein